MEDGDRDDGLVGQSSNGLEETCSESALLELTGRWGDPNPARLQRLSERGFIEDKLQVPIKGRAVLLFGRPN
jgi:hypothetical protein